MDNALRVHYRLTLAAGENGADKARGIALEQTAELPARCIPEPLLERHVGQVVDLRQTGEHTWNASIAYAAELCGGELTQLLNMLFGNISMKAGILITGIDWPETLLDHFGGPGHGIAGLRALLQLSPDQPLSCTALKPMGSDASTLAEITRAFAAGGVDIIKDDHGLANQPSARFRDRMLACQRAVEQMNAQQAGRSLYFPNVTAGPGELLERMAMARNAGCRGVLLSPWLCGLDSMRLARDEFGLAVLAHPAMTGSYFGTDHGLQPEVLLGDLFRVAGADAVIYPNTGGRFGFSLATCEAINHALRRPLGRLCGAMPAPGGGMDMARAAHWIDQYGVDTMVLIGGSLYQQDDLRGATRRLLATLGR
ncbi:RuBisCO large subunit C-terminal-like domain-containing protein [Methylonatrum kenyense]|uniref:RuBisCO large subunit C-terminal-like domain-containing protein n=1 Tax=Methylonatrum kenyense TaxID=455253 RepID=UPI0020BF7E0A|nr:RuBisCO large subunit C-terminal-like domain-containing protein [Methylonatrum kenyense]MCK8516043.1 RuBisCO large subunit C-terminal-like domain-containing protein [Methylonatrum kenyense]